MALRLAVLVIGATALVCVHGATQYDKKCDEIVDLGKQAASYANGGDMSAALQNVELARKVFQQAIALEPDNPQAFANLGVFLLNANMFNESILLLTSALERAAKPASPGTQSQIRGFLQQKIRIANYGYASSKRDQAYLEGKGNVTEAVEWALRQLDHTPMPARTQHELGTLLLVLCAYSDARCREANDHFVAAHTVAHQQYTTVKMPRDSKAKLKCIHAEARRAPWVGHPKVQSQTIMEALYVHQIDERVMINGQDGVVSFVDKDECSILSPSNDYYLDLAGNLFPQGMPALVPPQRRIADGMRVLSLMQYATKSFYHWIAEAIPRLVIAHLYFRDARRCVVLIPKLSPAESFITESLSLIFEDKYQLAEYYPFTEAPNLAFVSWETPHCRHRAGFCHAIAHPLALTLARDEIVRAVRRSPWNRLAFALPVVVLAMRGASTSMRNYDEAYHVIAVGNAVYFGSSADDTLYCLAAATGEVRWTYTTGGPIWWQGVQPSTTCRLVSPSGSMAIQSAERTGSACDRSSSG